jgi:hypothetical protein
MMRRRIHKRMYAVSKDGIGLIAGTMCYSRKAAIERFLCGGATTWEIFKHAGYRTVMAQIKIIRRPMESQP